MKYSKDGKVCFDETRHTYTLNEKYLQGVTGLISKFKNIVDTDKIATAFALKHGLDKDELIYKWEEEGRKSCEQGTAVHKVFETYVLSGKIELTGNYEKEKQAVKFIKELFETERLTPVDAEVIVYNECIASQIDCIAKNKKGQHFILDWKTNKNIGTCGYNKFLLHPFDQYPDACFYHYSLQLSIYKELLKDYEISDLFIVHINEQGYNIIRSEKIKIPKNILYYS